jgi:ceroid-lipofuscinosis MFS transporter 7
VIIFSFFVFDQYSVAAYFMAFLCVVTLFLLLTRFKASYRTEPPVSAWKSQRRIAQDELANRATRFGLSVYSAALIGLMILNISTLGSFASFETTGVRFAVSYFGLQPIVAGTIVSLSGMVGVCSLLNIGHLGKLLTDTQLIIGGITVFAVGTVSFASLRSVDTGANNSIVHYIAAIIVIYGVGYPIGQSAIIGLFSKGMF